VGVKRQVVSCFEGLDWEELYPSIESKGMVVMIDNLCGGYDHMRLQIREKR
jgi:hypothetical protein